MFFVSFVTFLVLFIFLLLVFLYIFPLKAAAVFNSEQQPDIYGTISWLNPFLKAVVTRHEKHMLITIYLVNRKVFSKDLPQKKDTEPNHKKKSYHDYIDIVKTLKLTKSKLQASYGFENPAITGMVCGGIDFMSQYINLDYVYNNPDFSMDFSYCYISAEAEVNVIISIVRILKSKTPHTRIHALSRS